MTAIAAPAGTRINVPARPSSALRRTHHLGILRAEWIKVVSLRSTWWALGATVALMTLAAFAVAKSLDGLAADPTTAIVVEQMTGAGVISGGYQIGMITIAVLGALAITGEYSTGMVRSTLAAVPTRLPVLAAKGVVLMVVTVAASVLSTALSYLVTQPMLARHSIVTDLAAAESWRVIGGAAFFLVVAALFSLGVGTVLRSTAGTVASALTVLLLLPGVLGFIRLDWVQTLVSYLPAPAASAFITGENSGLGQTLAPTAGLIVVIAYAVIPMVAGAVLLRRRDA